MESDSRREPVPVCVAPEKTSGASDSATPAGVPTLEPAEWLALILEASRDGVVVEESGRIVFANGPFARLHGYDDPRELVGHPIEDTQAIEDRGRIASFAVRRAAGDSAPVMYEYSALARDGSTLPLEASVSTFTRAGRTFTITITRDTRKRKRIERERRDAETKFRLLMQHAADAITIADPSGYCLEANPRVLEILGLTTDDIVGLNIRDLIPPADLETQPLRLQEVLAGSAVRTERTLLRKDGTPVDVELSSTLLPTGEILTISRDVSERRRAEEALRASEKKYRDLVETSNDLIWSVDTGGRVTFVNQAVRSILGLAPDLVVGRHFVDFLAPERVEDSLELFSRITSGELLTQLEVEARDVEGRPVVLSINALPTRDELGRVTGATGTATDVTHRKQLEEQLLQSQKMEAVGRLAAGVAHDFNNLLTVISGYTDLLLRRASDGSSRPELEEIRRSADRASDLTRQLLAFGRKQELRPAILDLNAVVSDMEKMLRRLIGEHIDLQSTLDPDAGCIQADPAQIGQVLINLVVNARDAMPRGGTLTLETRAVTVTPGSHHEHHGVWAGDYVAVHVRDTGTGMDPMTLSHIFEPFFTTKEPGHGTGLGLATVYGIVTQSGGHILVDSAPGEGTTFEVFLPRAAGPGGQPPREAAVAREGVVGGRETILVVEDEPGVRRLVISVLESLGYSVIEAGDGVEALEIVSRAGGAVDLVLSDLVMPRMGGAELADRLGVMEPDLRILFMSGYSEEGLPDLVQEGAPWLAKPFGPLDLAKRVRELLDGPE